MGLARLVLIVGGVCLGLIGAGLAVAIWWAARVPGGAPEGPDWRGIGQALAVLVILSLVGAKIGHSKTASGSAEGCDRPDSVGDVSGENEQSK